MLFSLDALYNLSVPHKCGDKNTGWEVLETSISFECCHFKDKYVHEGMLKLVEVEKYCKGATIAYFCIMIIFQTRHEVLKNRMDVVNGSPLV